MNIDDYYEKLLNRHISELTEDAEWEDYLHHTLQEAYLENPEPFAEPDTFEDFLDYFGEHFYKLIPLNEKGEEKPISEWTPEDLGAPFLSLIKDFLHERVFQKELMPDGERISAYRKRKIEEAKEPF